MSSDQMPAPGKTKLIKLPPSRAGKDVKCPGYARGGGMFKLRFDQYTTQYQSWGVLPCLRCKYKLSGPLFCSLVKEF